MNIDIQISKKNRKNTLSPQQGIGLIKIKAKDWQSCQFTLKRKYVFIVA
jgi:hypothetical protein